ncbi:MAG TPA: hypothetical protein PKW08_12995 [Flavobacteriaceae bacterium]|nr:hypothetical protein [Alteromonas sp.]HPF12343.1 hypothetical protein [Flavobacteriaceae bacterium]HQU22498.1 hypothetical protein [Flavobacteriaceae bacterium]HQU66460.1 hypothetical protein [Flavobacteriaceae bacterium]
MRIVHYCLFAAAIMLLAACESHTKDDLPTKPKDQLEAALTNWNTYYGSDIRSEGWSYEDSLDDEEDRKEAVDLMTDASTTWFPSIAFTDTTYTTKAVQLRDDPSVTQAAIDDWKSKVDGDAKVGQHLLKLQWKSVSDGKSFVSYCLADDDKLIYDSMLMNASRVHPSNSCFSYKMWWAWEGDDPANWTRGSIYADVTPTCRNGVPITCDKNCTASMTLGEAKINCTSTIVDNCCSMEYSWAWACGFKSVKVAADGFTLEVEGIIGSGGSGNGSCTRCCEVTPTP